MTDHAAEARNALEATKEKGERSTFADLYLAQTHATLALVEQQRIANLIAYASHRADRCNSMGGPDYPQALAYLLGPIDFEIREGLGLA